MLRSLLHQRVGRYYIKELLGRGGMAAVYRATDTVLQRDVALKVLYPQYGDDAGLVARFTREAVTAAALEHPGIVPVYDVDEQDGVAYIAMKLLAGRTLQDRLQEAGSISLDELIAVLTPVTAALDYAHSRGVVHRDIKPGNIFLHREHDDTHAILTDFGIAKQLDTPGLTTTGALIGTPDYMAPEQIAGRPVDGRTDVYALGMLAYRALTGRRAFEGSTQDVLLGHLHHTPPPPRTVNPALPPGIDDAVARAAASDPAARFATAGALLQALRQVAGAGAAVTTLSPSPLPPPSPVGAAPGPATPQVSGPTLAGAATRPGPAPRLATAPQLRGSATPTAAATLDARPYSLEGGAGRQSQRGSTTTPWILAVVLALIAGGLAVALYLNLTGVGSAAGNGDLSPPPVIPPSATLGPPSATPDQAVVVTTGTTAIAPSATPEPPTAEPPTATAPSPTALTEPTLPPPVPVAPSATATAEPSPTPPPTTEPPTATPTASPEPPTATPSPTTVVVRCPDGLMTGGFSRIYAERVQVREGLGCPREREVAGRAAQQFFERGMMYYWHLDNRTEYSDHIFVLFGRDNGRQEDFSPDQVAALEPEPTPGSDPNQPIMGFGRVYFNLPGAREALGAPSSPLIELKTPTPGVIQLFDTGLMLWTPSYQSTGNASIFVLYNDGTFERFPDPVTS